ncbi:putative anthocyanin 6''-O-malonyltransferase [Helianthus anomalus]
MASLPVLTVLDQPLVSPPPATVSDTSLPLTFFDIFYVSAPPIHFLFFYDLPLSTLQFTNTLVPNLKHSLSITLQHFFPYPSNLIVFPDRTRKPEIRYVEGDSVKVTFAECNLDFHDLTGYHPRDCDKFYHLIPLLGDCSKISNYVKIPVFSLQVTIFPNCGISIGMSIHHCLVDATTQFSFLKAWTSIARCGTDESFLANGTFPIYERLVKYPELDEIYLKRAKIEAFNKDYQLPNFRVQLIKSELPFTVACAYTWCCLAKSRNVDRQAFAIPLDCRTRMDPPIPAAYFGNCIWGCVVIAKTTLLTDKEGFITAAKLIGENLHKMLTDKYGTVKDKLPLELMLSDRIPTAIISIAGTPKLKLYDTDFGWGKPEKLERISLDYGASISIDAGKESDQDLEIGVCLTATQMQDFVCVFNLGLEPYI